MGWEHPLLLDAHDALIITLKTAPSSPLTSASKEAALPRNPNTPAGHTVTGLRRM